MILLLISNIIYILLRFFILYLMFLERIKVFYTLWPYKSLEERFRGKQVISRMFVQGNRTQVFI